MRILILVLILAANIDNVYALKMKYYALLKYHVLNFNNQIDCYESLESITLEKYNNQTIVETTIEIIIEFNTAEYSSVLPSYVVSM